MRLKQAGQGRLSRDDLQDLPSVSDLTPLAGLPKLRRVSLAQTDVVDLAPLAQIPSLRHLAVQDTPLADFGPIASMKFEELHLNLTGTTISDLSPLATVTTLKKLYIHCNEVSDATPLAGLTQLDKLSTLDLPNVAPEKCPTGKGTGKVVSRFCKSR